jgi:F420H(2)-dependent quinone reductase
VGLLEAAQGAFLRFHQSAYERSRGRIGHRMIGVPSLLLRTTGRHSGRERTVALVYASDGDDLVLVASNGGADRPPGWLHNVRAHPTVALRIGRRQLVGRARVVEPSDVDYQRLWKLVNDRNHGRYEQYQRKTARPIAMVVVRPS